MATRASVAVGLILLLVGVGQCGTLVDVRRAQLMRVEMSIEEFARECGRLPHSLAELVGVVIRVDKCADVQFLTPVQNRINGISMHYWKNEVDGSFALRWPGQDRIFGSADDVTLRPEKRVWGGTLIARRRWLQALALGAGLLSLWWLRRWWPRQPIRVAGP